MIEALNAWVKGIVFIVLFAAFLEFLLPNGGMQKFVRVIMGLLIMMAVLNPVIDLLDENPVNVQAAVLESTQIRNNSSADIDNAVNAAKIKRESLAREYYIKDLSRQIRATVLSVGGVANAKVTVKLKEDWNQKYENFKKRPPVPQIEQVLILAEPVRSLPPEAKKTVKISVEVGSVGKSSEEKYPANSLENSLEKFSGKLAQEKAPAELSPMLKEKIKLVVSELYHIGLETIEVQPFSALNSAGNVDIDKQVNN